MNRLFTLTAALTITFACTSGHAAEPAQKAPPRAKPVVKQLLQCKIGPYEKQTRFALETANGKPVYIAYWSSNGPYRCSFESAPHDGRTTWLDSSVGIVVSMLKGTLLIEDEKTHFRITAREVDRMPYCGTFGVISGVLTVPKDKKDCTWEEKTSEQAGHIDPEPAEKP
jgi:hypothetical protein